MADIVDFSTKNNIQEVVEENLSTNVLKEIANDINKIDDLLVFIKYKDNNINLFHTGLAVKELSYIVQLLTNDIQQELSPTEEIEFEPDL